MDESELHAFREQWKREIKQINQDSLVLSKDTPVAYREALHETSDSTGKPETITNTPSIKSVQVQDRSNSLENESVCHKKQKLAMVSLLTLNIPSYQNNMTESIKNNLDDSNDIALVKKSNNDQDLISLLIRDIDETTAVPFFDISLPKEVCVKIFSHLDVKDLCHCACVSKSWSSLANDGLLWQKIYIKLGFNPDRKSDLLLMNWKSLVRDEILRERTVTKNWKERICQIQTLEYEKGGALSACHLSDRGILIAGYANGKTCLWNTENNWRHDLEPSPDIFQASVECVTAAENVCAAAFTSGVVNVWHTDVSIDPVYQFRLTTDVHHLVLPHSQVPLLLTSSGANIRVDQVRDDGQWSLLTRTTFDSQVTFVHLVPDEDMTKFVVAMKEEIDLYNPLTESVSELDRIAGTKITAVDTSIDHIAVGWAPYGFGSRMEFMAKVRLYDCKSGRELKCFGGHYGDITCMNLNFRNGLVTGSKDKWIRVFDLRAEQPQLSLRGHSSHITTVQMDSWKVVSGAFDGTLKVWDMRMGTALWETRTNHPLRLCHFHGDRLVMASIPVDKVPRESMWYADDLILHRRHRGSIHVYDFSSSGELGVVPEEMTSNYDDIAGYNYNINLAAPYDALTSEIN